MNVSNLYNMYINLTNDMDTKVKDELLALNDRVNYVAKFKFKEFTVFNNSGVCATVSFSDNTQSAITYLGYICIKSLLMHSTNIPKCILKFSFEDEDIEVSCDNSTISCTKEIVVDDEALADNIIMYHFLLPEDAMNRNSISDSLKHLISMWMPFNINLSDDISIFRYFDIINNVKSTSVAPGEIVKAQEYLDLCLSEAKQLTDPLANKKDELKDLEQKGEELVNIIHDMEYNRDNIKAITAEVEILGQRNASLIGAIAEIDATFPIIEDNFSILHQQGKNNYDSEVKDLQDKKAYLVSAKADMEVEMVDIKQRYAVLEQTIAEYSNISEESISDKKAELDVIQDKVRMLKIAIDELSTQSMEAYQKVDTARYKVTELETRYGALHNTTVIDFIKASSIMQENILPSAYNKTVNFISYLAQYKYKQCENTALSMYDVFRLILAEV